MVKPGFACWSLTECGECWNRVPMVEFVLTACLAWGSNHHGRGLDFVFSQHSPLWTYNSLHWLHPPWTLRIGRKVVLLFQSECKLTLLYPFSTQILILFYYLHATHRLYSRVCMCTRNTVLFLLVVRSTTVLIWSTDIPDFWHISAFLLAAIYQQASELHPTCGCWTKGRRRLLRAGGCTWGGWTKCWSECPKPAKSLQGFGQWTGPCS